MDVLPALLNRDSFRDSFKGLVALEIILDLPFGFPINNIISLYTCIYVYIQIFKYTCMYTHIKRYVYVFEYIHVYI